MVTPGSAPRGLVLHGAENLAAAHLGHTGRGTSNTAATANERNRTRLDDITASSRGLRFSYDGVEAASRR